MERFHCLYSSGLFQNECTMLPWHIFAPNMDFEPISQHHPRRCCGPIESSAPPLQRGWGQHSTELLYVHYNGGSVYVQFGPHSPCHSFRASVLWKLFRMSLPSHTGLYRINHNLSNLRYVYVKLLPTTLHNHVFVANSPVMLQRRRNNSRMSCREKEWIYGSGDMSQFPKFNFVDKAPSKE